MRAVVLYIEVTRQFQACLFFFWGKDFLCTKTCLKQKSANKTNELTLNNKSNNFWWGHKLLGVTCFCACEIFSSKKSKQAWNCLDNLNIQYYSLIFAALNKGYARTTSGNAVSYLTNLLYNFSNLWNLQNFHQYLLLYLEHYTGYLITRENYWSLSIINT